MQAPAIALGVLAILLVVSGLDDLAPLLLYLCGRQRNRAPASGLDPASSGFAERHMAIFVPCWRESAVIGNMVRHNLSVIRYRNFDFFLGVYPNDQATRQAVARLEAEFPNVHAAECPHPGPTSKADCLNAIYRRMELFEQESGERFDTIVLHDAEDLIHPQALALINRERREYDMVQVPVLPLQTRFSDVTHGVYCDEFSEYQMIDMRARQHSRSFIPSNGVGTGFSREILHRLAHENGQLVFNPASLTEDYEIGVAIHAMGYRQLFCPLTRSAQGWIATREYFPRTAKTAIRQRTRWVTGIALQCWERHGWQGSWRARYWFWRDRKGLVANPLSVIANLVFVAGVADYLAALLLHRPWHFTVQSRGVAVLCSITLFLQWLRLGLRAACVAHLYDLRTALAVPLRCFHANLINCTASICALRGYLAARRRKHALAWHKTDHSYPRRETLEAHRRELSEVLIGCGYLSKEQVAEASVELAGADSTLDLLLLAKGVIKEEDLCTAISLQSGLAAAQVDPRKVNVRVARGLPTVIQRQFGVVPFDVKGGRLLVATPVVPSNLAIETVEEATELAVEFQLVTHSTFEKLCALL